MNDIGLFISTFGGMGMFIWYLLNRDKTTSKEQTDAIKKVGGKIDKQTESMDDFSFLLLDLIDNLVHGYSKRGNVKALKNRIQQRQYERSQSDNAESSDL